MLELRPYQSEAVEALYRYLRANDDNPCIVIPTAGGKPKNLKARTWPSQKVSVHSLGKAITKKASE